MACPFGVIRYHEDAVAPPGKTVAVKCDNCYERRQQKRIPACVEACMVAALTFETEAGAMKRKTDEISRSVSTGAETAALPPGFELLNTLKKVQIEMRNP